MEGIMEFEECMAWLMWLPKRPRVNGCQGIFKEAGDIPWLKRVWCRLLELPKNPSVVGCKVDIQEGGRHSEGWRGKGGSLWSYMV